MADMMTDIPVREGRSVKIGQGSFASVWAAGGLAFKVCLHASGQDELKQEFNHLTVIHKTCNFSNHFFLIPRPVAFSPLQDIDLIFSPSSVDPAVSSRRHIPDIGPARFQELRLHGLETAAFALSRVREITLTVAEYVRQHFYPSHCPLNAPLARLCRIYLGKPTSAPSRFLNTNNFNLDLKRYTQLALAMSLPSAAQVAFGMGETLGRLHFAAKLDGRDIEFVLGSVGEEISEYYCLDFNQCRKWHAEHDSISDLVAAFFANDPYFPRPRTNEELWVSFRGGYLLDVGSRQKAHQVLCALESRQAELDSQKDSHE